MFIVIEGQDATGKDLQAKKLREYFKKRGKKVVHYAESGTNSDQAFIREIAKLNYGSSDYASEKEKRMMLYLINRLEQWRKIAEPALAKNQVMITSRNWLSTLIYVGYGLGYDREAIEQVHRTIMPPRYFEPDFMAIFTLSKDERAMRLKMQGERKREFFKSQNNEFQQRINDAYLEVAERYKIPTVDAKGAPDEVFERLLRVWGFEQ